MTSDRNAASAPDELHKRASPGLMAVIERDLRTGMLVGQVIGFPAAQTQGESIDEVCVSLMEVIDLLRREGAIKLESAFIALIRL